MDLKSQKSLAARTLKVGKGRIWIDPTRIDDVSMSIRREDIRRLVHDGFIKVKPKKGISRARARILHQRKKSGKRRGHGSRKGKKTARMPKKEAWMKKIRPIRKYLKRQRDRRIIDTKTYRVLYRKAKGGFFKSVSHLEHYIKEEGLSRR